MTMEMIFMGLVIVATATGIGTIGLCIYSNILLRKANTLMKEMEGERNGTDNKS